MWVHYLVLLEISAIYKGSRISLWFHTNLKSLIIFLLKKCAKNSKIIVLEIVQLAFQKKNQIYIKFYLREGEGEMELSRKHQKMNLFSNINICFAGAACGLYTTQASVHWRILEEMGLEPGTVWWECTIHL